MLDTENDPRGFAILVIAALSYACQTTGRIDKCGDLSVGQINALTPKEAFDRAEAFIAEAEERFGGVNWK